MTLKQRGRLDHRSTDAPTEGICVMASTAVRIENEDIDDESSSSYEKMLATNLDRLVTSSFSKHQGETGGREEIIADEVSIAPPSVFRIHEHRPQISLQPIQEWEGCVTEVSSDHFTARLIDLTVNDQTEREVGEFPISDLSDDDRELLLKGAIFRWVIGYQVLRGGTRQRISQVVFRRLSAWSKKDLAYGKEQAAEIISAINWE